MATFNTFEPFQLSALFEGELSSADSEGDSSETPVPSLVQSSPKSSAKKAKTVMKVSRPRRQEVVKSYAESDTDEEVSPATLASKRKRTNSHNGSPTKKMRLDAVQTPRGRGLHSRQVSSQSPTRNAASLPDTLTLAAPRPSVNARKRMFVKLGWNGESISSPSLDGYWWPAKKVVTTRENEGLVYQLYGDDGHGNRNVIIKNPGPTNMHSIYHPKPPIPRYSHISFQRGTAIDTSRFLGALNQLNQDDDDDDSSLQEELMASDGEHIPPSPSSPQDWRPPSPSEFENVIDQHILCRSNRGSTVHWPARVVAYIPPTKSSQKPRFTVDFFDWKTTEVTRDMFFTQYDEDEKGFATCELDRRKLQEWVEKNALSPDGNDIEDVDTTGLPEPRFPIPKPAIFIEHVTIQGQFVYVMPFMRRILEETYPPSQARIDAWMKGGSARIGITSNPIQGGNLAEVEWHMFGQLVRNWAIPGFKASTEEGLPTVEEEEEPHPPPIEDFEAPERPRGSERYEHLPLSQKLQFVSDVLIGEAVIQLLIIRAGKRSDLNLLGEAKEAELYHLGVELSTQESTSIMVRTILESRREIRKRLCLSSEPLIAAGTKPEPATEIGARRSQTRIRSK